MPTSLIIYLNVPTECYNLLNGKKQILHDMDET